MGFDAASALDDLICREETLFHGEGAYVWDADGTRYADMHGGEMAASLSDRSSSLFAAGSFN